MLHRSAVALAAISLPAVMSIGAPASMAAAAPAAAFSHWRVSFHSRQGFPDAVISVAASGPKDAWAADVPQQISAGRVSRLVHWNGHSWAPGHPLPAGFTPVTVRERGRSDLWVFGENSAGKEALRWDGRQWQVVAVPAAAGISDPVVLGPGDVWVAGQSTQTAHGWTSALWHWNGSAWSDHPAPVRTDAAGGLLPIAGSSPSNLWVVSRALVGKQNGQRLIAYHWAGTSWKWVSVPHPRVASLPSVAVTAATNIWFSAQGLPEPGEARPQLAWHWNGRTLHATGESPSAHFGVPAPDGLGGLWLGPLQYWSGGHWFRGHLAACTHGNSLDGQIIAGIPGTHSALQAGICAPGGAGSPQGLVSVSRPAT
jgi:hypothetical protein